MGVKLTSSLERDGSLEMTSGGDVEYCSVCFETFTPTMFGSADEPALAACSRDEAIEWLRECLRDLGVYTIEDVCEVWGVDDVTISVCRIPCEGNQITIHSGDVAARGINLRATGKFAPNRGLLATATTRADALADAYRNGVKARGGGDE